MFVSVVMTAPEHMDYFKEICDLIHVKHYAPLWGRNPLADLAEVKDGRRHGRQQELFGKRNRR